MTDPGTADDHTSLAVVLERLERLEQQEAARSLLASYARACDRADLAGVVSLFSPSATLRTPHGEFHGTAEIEGFYSSTWHADPSAKRHFVVHERARRHEPGLVHLDAYFLFTGRGVEASRLGWGEYEAVVETRSTPVLVELTIVPVVATTLADGWQEEIRP